MEKSILKFILLLSLVIWQGNLFLSSNSLVHAHTTFEKVEGLEDKSNPDPIECKNTKGEVISYGSTCKTGSTKCTPNDCPTNE
jgi:hypothetical protein